MARRERIPLTYWIGDWVRPIAGLDYLQYRKKPCPFLGSNDGSAVIRSIAKLLYRLPAYSGFFSILDGGQTSASGFGPLMSVRDFSVPNGWEAEWATNLWCQNEHVIKAARILTIAKRTGEVHEPRLPLPWKGTHALRRISIAVLQNRVPGRMKDLKCQGRSR